MRVKCDFILILALASNHLSVSCLCVYTGPPCVSLQKETVGGGSGSTLLICTGYAVSKLQERDYS